MHFTIYVAVYFYSIGVLSYFFMAWNQRVFTNSLFFRDILEALGKSN